MPNLVRSDFTLENASFEIRYPQAFVLWDTAGKISNELCKKWPEMKTVEAQPASIKFRLGRNYNFAVELEKAYIGAQLPAMNLKDFCVMASELTSVVQEYLELSHFDRVGLRLIHFKKFESIDAATEAMLHTSKLVLPKEKIFGQELVPSSAEYAIRWENEKTGVRVNVKTETVMVDFSPPAIFSDLKPIKEKQHKFVYDVDYYTVAKVAASQLRVTDWINSVVHLVNRDSAYSLGA